MRPADLSPYDLICLPVGTGIRGVVDPMSQADSSDATAALGKSFGADLAARAEEGILVHELTHAIDDQYFDLAKGSKSDPLLDESAAYLGLVEGDATVTMFDYILGKRIDAVPGFFIATGFSALNICVSALNPGRSGTFWSTCTMAVAW